jgi:UDP-N-acetyl-D-galactosamine dehydrogenase
VDPYYLTAKAEQIGYQPEVILSGRRVNDGMGAYLAQRVVKLIAASGRPIVKARVGILGFTFKENVPDIRNSKVVDTYRELREFGIEPLVHDARADAAAVRHEYDVELRSLEEFRGLDALIYAVGHEEYRPLHDGFSDMVSKGGIVADVRSLLDAARLRPDIVYWSL